MRGSWKPGVEGTRAARRLHVLEAQRLVDFYALRFAPAVAAGVLIFLQTDDVVDGVALFAAMLLIDSAIARLNYPLHLMPVSRALLGLLTPVVAAAVLYIVESPARGALEPNALAVAIVGAWLINVLGLWAASRFRDTRKVCVAVVGDEDFARNLSDELACTKPRSYEVVGWLGTREASPGSGAPPWLGTVGRAREVIEDRGVELFVHAPGPGGVVGRPPSMDVHEQLADACLAAGGRLIWANQFCEDELGHVPLGAMNSAWFRYIMHPRYRGGSPFVKRGFDLVVGSILGLLALPLIGIAAVGVLLSSGRPLFYRQHRVGERGRQFEIVKLRTMRCDAERDGPRWCDDEDSRVTAFGRLLRRTHIDELPQLWNVLSGEMSIIGPRPERPELEAELRHEIPFYDRRHLAKPGMTGWAQIRCGYAGSTAGTAFKLCHDLHYLKYRSAPRDLLILFETAVVLTKKVLLGQPRVVPSPLSAPSEPARLALGVAEDSVEDRSRVLDADLA